MLYEMQQHQEEAITHTYSLRALTFLINTPNLHCYSICLIATKALEEGRANQTTKALLNNSS